MYILIRSLCSHWRLGQYSTTAMPLRVCTWARSDSTKDGPTFWSESECEGGIDVTTATATTQNLAQPPDQKL